MTARLSPISADWEKGRALPRPCRGASLFSEQLAPSEMYSRLVGIQVEGVRVRAQIGFFFFFSVDIFVIVAAAASSCLSVAWIFVSFVQTLHVPRGGEKGTPTRCLSEHQPISFHCL